MFIRSAHLRGTMLALAAAVAFGLTTPVVGWAAKGAGSLTVAALLYVGAAFGTLMSAPFVRRTGPRPGIAETPRLLAMATMGAAVAPTLLAWGVVRTGATSASLALNLEAVFSMVLARVVFHEALGRRVLVAMAFTVGGAALLALDASRDLTVGVSGLVAVAAATLAWALDNTWSRAVSIFDGGWVVAIKSVVGAALTVWLALVQDQPWPIGAKWWGLVLSGATGYGLSLRLYLSAQRTLGAGRTASVFAFGPFVGAVVSWVVLDEAVGAASVAGAAAFAMGILLHATEEHGHAHRHVAESHTHAHRHDDGHHEHHHHGLDDSIEHTHEHHHDSLTHNHEHASDLHHSHVH